MFRSVPFCGPKNTRSSFQAMGMLKTNWPSGNTPAWLKSQSWLAIHAVSYTWLWVQTDRQSSLPQLMRHSGCGIVLWWTQLSRKRASPVLHRVQLSDKGFDELLQDSYNAAALWWKEITFCLCCWWTKYASYCRLPTIPTVNIPWLSGNCFWKVDSASDVFGDTWSVMWSM